MEATAQAHGLNPSDAADANTIDPATGHTHLETYLQSLVGQYPAKP